MSARKVIGNTPTDHNSKVHMDYDPMIDNDDDDDHVLKTGYIVPTTPTRNEDHSSRSLSHSAERKTHYQQQQKSRLNVETSSFSQSDDFQRIFDGENTTLATTPKSDNKNRLLSPFASPITSPFASPRNNTHHQHHKSSLLVGGVGSGKGGGGGSVGSNSRFLDDGPEIYYVQQRYGYFSILFSLAQTAILIVMMKNCGVAPFRINPMFGPYPDALSEWGAKNAVNILDDGEWWRLLTPIMLHAGVIHLICNVAVQLETGAFFEREWGSRNWLIIYLTSAVGSSILSVIFMPNAISVGSSGAVMGLFGGKLAEIICRYCDATRTKEEKIGHQVRQEQCGAVLCSVTLVMLFSFIPYVDWAAHLGGVLAGLCVGLVVFGLEITTSIWKLLWFLIGIALTTLYYGLTLQKMYSGDITPMEELRDVCGYYKEYFDDYECNCMREEQAENAGEGGGGR